VTHIIASNLTPKKRVEFERYKVVRPEWIVDCVKAGKALPWNQYRLIDRSSQKNIGLTQKPVDGYRAVSSRDEKIVYRGGGLRNESSQESSSYPTPPEMKVMDLDDMEIDIKQKPPLIPPLEMEREETDMDVEIPRDLSLIDIATTKHVDDLFVTEIELPSTLSSIDISSPSQAHGIHNMVTPDLPDQHLTFHNSPTAKMDPSVALASALLPSEPSSPPHDHDSIDPPGINQADIAAVHNATILANPSLRSSTVVNPAFLKSYFDQSRLHHLSAWKADLKNQMQQLTSQNPPRRTKKTADQPRWIMHVDFDCFFCSVSLVSRPELKDKPVCVGHGGAKSGEIASCNYPAREFGIHNGMR
jgi:DNA repair protein REV1